MESGKGRAGEQAAAVAVAGWPGSGAAMAARYGLPLDMPVGEPAP